MAFNGSGAFVRLYNWVADRNAAIKIRADRMDAEMDGFATGLSNTITRDGQSTVSANIPFNNKRITGLADATAANDAMNRQSSDARFTPRVMTKTANYTLLAGDIGSLIIGTGTWTLSLLAAATAANGFSFRIKNTGTGLITIDPNASETINGAATFVLPPGQELTVISDGSTWLTIATSTEVRIADETIASNTDRFAVIPLGSYQFLRFSVIIRPNSAAASDCKVLWRLSTDGGATYPSGASDYANQSDTGADSSTGAASSNNNSGFLTSTIARAAATPGRVNAEFEKGSANYRATMLSKAYFFNGTQTQVYDVGSNYSTLGVATHLLIFGDVTNCFGVGTRLIVEGF
jgi:hypothetical protein